MFVTPAYAQAAGAAPSLLNSMFVPMILVLGIMYFLMIRPQQKKLKDDAKMRESLRRGDQVVTQGGLMGKIAKVHDSDVDVEIAQGVKVKMTKGSIVQVVSKTEPTEG